MAAAEGADGPVHRDVVLGGVTVELVHIGSLHHDDVIDEAVTRRTVESVNARWGNLRAILSGDFLLAKAPEPRPSDPEPDVRQLVRDNLAQVFTAASQPRHVRVSPPRRELNGMGWTACIKAELTSVTGRSLGTQTYLATINGGIIRDRRRVEADDNCASETYEGI